MMNTNQFCLFLFRFCAYANGQDLSLNYYDTTCPHVSSIVSEQTARIIAKNSSFVAAFLKLIFHDCFVRGCDASILLESTTNNSAEKDAAPNLTLVGLDKIDIIKAAVEKKCPGVVSCADIIALASKDAVNQSGGPSWDVALGRLNGIVSLASDALKNLPSPYNTFHELNTAFADKGLNSTDLVVLTGAHKIGESHCFRFSDRLEHYDRTLNSTYAALLRQECSSGGTDMNTNNTVSLDRISPNTFDVSYYVDVYNNEGLLSSDAALLDNKNTAAYVYNHLEDNAAFFKDFAASMVKLISIPGASGSSGQVRLKCSVINS